MALQIIFFLSMALCVFANTLSLNQQRDLDNFITTTMGCREGVGFTIAMVKDGQTVYKKAYGFRDNERQLPMTTSTITAIASISKAFTTALISDAVAKRDLLWDAPLREVIPDFALPGDFRTQLCSLRDAVSHKIGFPNYWGVSMSCMNVSREELVRRMAHFPPRHEFRETYRYANYPFVMAARALEVKTGKTWEQLMREKIFDPLGMPNAKVSPEIQGSDWDEVAWGHTVYEGNVSRNPESTQIPFLNEIGPSAGVFASAEDMPRWMNFHLSGGKNENGTQIFDANALSETYRSSNSLLDPSWRLAKPQFPVDDVDFTYALAWRTGMYRGHEKIYHTGSYSGYNCRMTLLPGVNIGAWTCTNSPGNWKANTAVRTVNLYALDLMMGEEPWLNTTTTCTFPEPWVESNSKAGWRILHGVEDRPGGEEINMEGEAGSGPPHHVPSLTAPLRTKVHNRDLYIGEYDHPAFGTFRIFEENGALRSVFGRFMNGEFRRELGMGESRLRMFLDFPLTYRMYSRDWTQGYPTDFAARETVGAVTRYNTVRIAFLEPSWPPTFVRKGHSVEPTTTTTPVTPCPTQVVGGQSDVSPTFLIIVINVIIHALLNM